MAVKIQDRVGGRKRRSYETDEFQRRHEQDRFGAVNPNRGDGNYVGKTNSKPKPAQTSLGNPKGLRDLEKTSGSQSTKSRRDDYGGYSPGVAKKTNSNLTDRGYPSSKNPTSQPKPSQTNLGNPKGLRDLDKKTGKSSTTESILRAAMKASERAGTIRKLSSDRKSVNTVSKAADRVVRNTSAAYKGYSGQSLRSNGEGKRYVSGEEYETYRKAKVQKQKDTESDRIKEAERRAAAGEPLRAKGEEKRYVSGAEYEAYRKAKNKAKKGK